MTTARAPITAEELDAARDLAGRIDTSVASRLVGQRTLRKSLLVTLIAGGHILLESVPGLAKTLAAATLAASVDGTFARVQCTPDLLPSDIVGTQIFDPHTTQFRTQLGPVHVNFVLLDEINRSSAKTQSAMLEAMQERQTSIGGVTYRLPDPFMVMATQNPIEEEGTYVLPQAQMDRFLLKEVMTYPTPAEELRMVERIESGVLGEQLNSPVATLDDVFTLRGLSTRV
ncbi:AAA family ATPase, partial [Acidipropionibacterium jensenii]|uniref:AAA family ATPase n=1 Tax=Acidipropionibacterium jensenii TaxID=1749 RepID=UPI002649F6A5